MRAPAGIRGADAAGAVEPHAQASQAVAAEERLVIVPRDGRRVDAGAVREQNRRDFGTRIAIARESHRPIFLLEWLAGPCL